MSNLGANIEMEIILLSKPLADYPNTEQCERAIIRRQFNDMLLSHNVRVIKNRFENNFEKNCRWHFCMDGNELKTTSQIIAMVRVSVMLSLLTDEQWKRAIPIIERGLKANVAYTNMLDEMSPIFEKYCSEWEDVGMRNTFMERIHLECWQGRFSKGHWANPEQKPNYT